MATNWLGRTNREFPLIWLSLADQAGANAQEMVEAARGANVPLDISRGPARWGGLIRGDDSLFLVQTSNSGFENATDDRHASDLIQAHLIETLSSIGRERIDAYFLRIRHAVEEYQIAGALEAMEMARQEGHIGFLGLCCDGPSLATLSMWQFHDAFDLVLAPHNAFDQESYKTLAPLAQERRVGVVGYRPFSWTYGLPFLSLAPEENRAELAQSVLAQLSSQHPVLVGVSTAEEVKLALEAPKKTPMAGLDRELARYVDLLSDESQWAKWLNGDNPEERSAAMRRARALR